jgi:dihydroorotate dehydrogenase electron transfer subunit
LDELEKSKKLTIVTDDGSLGAKDNAVSAYLNDKDKVRADLIIACGPPIMLKVLKAQLKERDITTPCLVSLEERMGCGIGACLVCVCKKSDKTNARVCLDGPVFDINEVEL